MFVFVKTADIAEREQLSTSKLSKLLQDIFSNLTIFKKLKGLFESGIDLFHHLRTFLNYKHKQFSVLDLKNIRLPC